MVWYGNEPGAMVRLINLPCIHYLPYTPHWRLLLMQKVTWSHMGRLHRIAYLELTLFLFLLLPRIISRS